MFRMIIENLGLKELIITNWSFSYIPNSCDNIINDIFLKKTKHYERIFVYFRSVLERNTFTHISTPINKFHSKHFNWLTWYLFSIFETHPCETRNWRLITQGRTPAAAISTIFSRMWFGRGRPLMKTPPSWFTLPWPNNTKYKMLVRNL